jgi:hypothetical protein
VVQNVWNAWNVWNYWNRINPMERYLSDLREQLAPASRWLAIPASFQTAEIIPGSLSAALERDFRAKAAALSRADRADFAERCRL